MCILVRTQKWEQAKTDNLKHIGNQDVNNPGKYLSIPTMCVEKTKAFAYLIKNYKRQVVGMVPLAS